MKTLKNTLLICGCLLCSLAASANTCAQGLGSVVGSTSDMQDRFTYQRQMLGSMILRDMVRHDLQSEERNKRLQAQAAQQTKAQIARGKQVIASGRATTEVQSLQTMSVPQEFAVQMKMTSEQAEAFEKLVKAVEDSYLAEIKTYGLKGHDITSATVALIDVCRQINLEAAELTKPQVAALYAELHRRLLESEYAQGMSDAQRRKAYESIVMTISLAAGALEEAKATKSMEELTKARAAAADIMKAVTGYTPDQITTEGERVIVPKPIN